MTSDVPVGICIPYSNGNSGFFKQTFSDVERAHTNLKMLLLTAKGERPLVPTYGSDLRSLLFSPDQEQYDSLLVDAVHDATEKWMPEIVILNVDVVRDIENAPNSAEIFITFNIVSIPNSNEQLKLEIY